MYPTVPVRTIEVILDLEKGTASAALINTRTITPSYKEIGALPPRSICKPPVSHIVMDKEIIIKAKI
ncbi:hypothetical protein D3C73_1646910 [compost metagenome]